MTEDEDRETFIRNVRGLGNEALARQLCDKRHPVFGGQWWRLPSMYRAGFLSELTKWANLVNLEGQRRKGETRRPGQPQVKLAGGGASGVGGPDDPDAPPRGATAAQIRAQEAAARKLERELLGPKGPHWNGLDWVND